MRINPSPLLATLGAAALFSISPVAAAAPTAFASSLNALPTFASILDATPLSTRAPTSSGLTPTVVTDTDSNLLITWSWDLSSASSTLNLANSTLQHWNVSLNSSAFTLNYNIPGIGLISVPMLAANISGNHVGESGIAQYTWLQNNIGSFSTGAQGTLNGDSYSFTAYRNNNGDVTFSLAGVHPVPEPASCAMLLAGLGMLGLLSRKRKAD